jgi:predicted acylesterase/phospholipase RssA
MNKIGLALSGGGFRASLYHLGLVRFLRDASVLGQVTHITSVSGGSIFAAHLVLNWDRYNGSANKFDAAAFEFLSFVRLDVRNRIARRFPLTLPLRWPRRLLGRSNRKLTRTGCWNTTTRSTSTATPACSSCSKSPTCTSSPPT